MSEADLFLAQDIISDEMLRWLDGLVTLESLLTPGYERPGYVYVIKSQSTELYKIGRTHDVKTRLKQLSVADPKSLILICALFCNDAVLSETLLHQLYVGKRIHGEWFSLDETDLKWIKAVMLYPLLAQKYLDYLDRDYDEVGCLEKFFDYDLKSKAFMVALGLIGADDKLAESLRLKLDKDQDINLDGNF